MQLVIEIERPENFKHNVAMSRYIFTLSLALLACTGFTLEMAPVFAGSCDSELELFTQKSKIAANSCFVPVENYRIDPKCVETRIEHAKKYFFQGDLFFVHYLCDATKSAGYQGDHPVNSCITQALKYKKDNGSQADRDRAASILTKCYRTFKKNEELACYTKELVPPAGKPESAGKVLAPGK